MLCSQLESNRGIAILGDPLRPKVRRFGSSGAIAPSRTKRDGNLSVDVAFSEPSFPAEKGRYYSTQFKAAFTAAQGWGTYSQEQNGTQMHSSIVIKWGRLEVKSLALAPKNRNQNLLLKVDGMPVKANPTYENGRLIVELDQKIDLLVGNRLEVWYS